MKTVRPARRKVRCPRCRCVELILRESIVNFTTFEQYADGRIDAYGEHGEGFYFRVDATCVGCKHKWRIKNASQITDIRDDKQPQFCVDGPTDKRARGGR